MIVSRVHYVLIGACRLWALAANLIVVYVVSTHLSADEQGYYYAFQSLGASQFFFDLGVGFVLANVAGRRVASAQLAGRSGLEAVASVLRFSMRWSGLAALALASALYAAGTYMFPEATRPAWHAYGVLVALSMAMNVQLSILEGVGRVLAVSVVRAVQSAVFVVGLLLGTAHDLGLGALPWALLASTLPVLAWLLWVLGPAWRQRLSEGGAIFWRRDILPFQWRMAISWVAGYFVFQAPVPFLFKVVGPAEAGQLGLTMQIFQALTTLAGILLSTRVRTWTQLAVEAQHQALRHDLWRVTRWTVGAVVAGALALLGLRWLVAQVSPAHAARVVDADAWLWLTVAAAANQIFFSLNYFFRAQGQEPLWRTAAAAGAAAVVVAWMASPDASVVGAVIVYTAISVLIHAGGSLLIYRAHARA